MKLRYAYYVADTATVRKTIQQIDPDVVHIHGLSFSTKQYIDLLRELQIPFVVTLHGLIGLNDSVVASAFDKRYERAFLMLSQQEDIPVTVISSGIKNRIQQFYELQGKNLYVVPNGIATERIAPTAGELQTFRNKIGVCENESVIICVGNITENKNQKQVIESLPYLPRELRDNLRVVFAGKDVLDGKLQVLAQNLAVKDRVLFLGFLQQEELSKLYDIADLNVFSSLNDGFGLPIVEGYLHGVPVVTFDDLDAFEEIYDPCAVSVPKDRTTPMLAQAIEQGLQKKWDKEKLQELAQKFSLSTMAKNYVEVYKTAISRKRTGI